jgi:hypothetical protein
LIKVIHQPKKERKTMQIATVIFYVLVVLGLIQIDRRLHDIVKAVKAMRP